MSIWLGVGFALCSTVASSAAYVLQKIAHNRYDADHPVPEGVKVGNGDAAGQPESVKEGPPTPPATPETQKPASVGVVGTRPNSPVPIPRAETASPSGERVSRSPDAVTIAVEAADASEAHSPAPDMPVLPHPEGKRSYTRYWQFPAGLALLVIGTIFAAAVFGLAPQSTLAPLGSVTMILNTIFSWKFLGEAFTRVDAVSIVLMAVGTTVAVLFGKGHDPKYTLDTVVNLFLDRPAAWGLAISSAGAIAVATVFVATVGKARKDEMSAGARRLDVFCRAFLGAAWSGYSNYASKAVVEVGFASVADGTGRDWTRPQLYLLAFIMIASLFMQVKYLNVGLAKYDAMIVVRLYQAMLALFSILSGFFYFNEVASQSAFSLTMFCVGIFIVMIGICVGMLRNTGVVVKAVIITPTSVGVEAPHPNPDDVIPHDDDSVHWQAEAETGRTP